MIVLLAPAKTLDFAPTETTDYTQSRLLHKSQQLIETLQQKSVSALRDLMNISEKLATENAERYRNFHTPFDLNNAKQAVLAFKGDVYRGLQAETFSEADLEFAQGQLRILSGLYGVLRPLDLMQAYRLEMGTKLKQNGSKNLYEFWNDTVTQTLNEDIAETNSDWVVNLASNEYVKVLQKEKLDARWLEIDFKENRNGKLKTIAFNAKKARGGMGHQIVKYRITEIADLRTLIVDDYVFDEHISTETHYVFVRS